MASSSHVRVGDPEISSSNQIFILSDPSGSDSLLIRPITITEGAVPVITVVDDIELTLPDELTWDPNRLPAITGSAAAYLESTTLTSSNLSLSNHVLTIAVNQDFDPAHNQLVLSNGYVLPTAVMTDIGHIQLAVNQWVDGADAADAAYKAVDDVIITTAEQTFVLSDSQAPMATMTISRVGNWEVLDNRPYRIILPEGFHFKDGDVSVAPSYPLTISNDTLRFTSNSTASSTITLTGTYLLQETQVASSVSVSANPEETVNTVTSNMLRIGQPSVTFSGGEQIFVLSDSLVELETIIYSESVAGTAIPGEEIRIYIPDNPSIDWSTVGSASLTQGTGSVASSVTIAADTLVVTVTSALSGNAVVQISNAQLDLGSVETDTTLLGLLVNRVAGDDAVMASSSHVRVGDPELYSNAIHTFIATDMNAEVIEKIFIIENENVSCINHNDHIKIIIPDDIGIWWSDNIELNPENVYFIENLQNAEDHLNIITHRFLISTSRKELTIYVASDFDSGDSLIIGGLTVDVSNVEYLISDQYFELAVNDNDTVNVEYVDSYPLIITSPKLIFTEEIGLVVNDPPTAFNGLILQEHNQYGTIKKDQRIQIVLPNDPPELKWLSESIITLDTTYLYSDSTEIIADGKVFSFVPKENFPINYELNLGGLKIDTVSTRIIDGDDLNYKIRSSTTSYLLSEKDVGVSKSYWVAKPEVYSSTEQIYYLRKLDGQILVETFKTLVIHDDDINPIMNRYRQSMRIKLPENVKWNTADDFITQYGKAAGNLLSVVSFTEDSLSVNFTFQQNFGENDSLFVNGLSIIPFLPSGDIDHLLISFNQGESINIIDEQDFYVGEISFTSSNENIVLKGGNNTEKFSRIRLEEKSILPKLNNLIINIPPELSVIWSEEQVFTTGSFEGTSETILNKLDIENIIIDPESEQKLIIPFIGQNQMEPGDIIYIRNLLYHNESALNTQSRISYLGLEVANGIILPDSIPTYLASAYFESLSGNNIINRDSLHAFRINEMTIANDTTLFNIFGVELVEAGDTLLINVPNEFSILWSDSIENNLSITDIYGNDWKDSKISISINDQQDELSLILIEDIEGNTLSINNLQVDIADSTGLGYIKLFNKNTGELLGVDKHPIAIGTPTISFLEDKNIVWLNSARNKKLPMISIIESIIPLLTDHFSLVLYDSSLSTFIQFDTSITDEIEYSIQFYPEIEFSEDNRMITFSNFGDGFGDELAISNIPLVIRDDVFNIQNPTDLLKQSLRVSINNRYLDNYSATKTDLELTPSLFFTKPLVYNKNGINKISFNIKNNFLMDYQSDFSSMAEDLALYIGTDFISLDDNTNVSTRFIDQIEIENYLYLNLTELTLNIDEEIVDRINICLDHMSVKQDSAELKILYNLLTDRDNLEELKFYPDILPLMIDFNEEYRSFNSDSTFLEIDLNADVETIGIPSVRIASAQASFDTTLHEINYTLNVVDNNKIRLNFDQLLNNEKDGLYKITLMFNYFADTSSIPFQRYFLLDRTPPDIYQFSPFPGQKPDGRGQDITVNDTLGLYISDWPVYFDIHGVKNPNVSTLPIDLTYIFDNQKTINYSLSINNNNVASQTDTFKVDSSLNGYYSINNELYKPNLIDKRGDLSYTFTIKDKAGNRNNIDVLFYLVLNQNSANAHFFNYPNPFSPRNSEITNFRYTLLKDTEWGKLFIFDSNGDLVYLYQLKEHELSSGTHNILWDGNSIYGSILANGVYFSIIEFPKNKTRFNKIAVIN